MNTDHINTKEELNDGSKIHLFYDDRISVWVAYGKSAFALRRYLKSLSYDNLRVYSSEMQMPLTVTGVNTINKIRALKPFQSEDDNFIEILPR